MGIKTKIEWTDSSINPIMGCTGCVLRENHCYAAVLCTRYAGRKGWPKSFDQPEFFPSRLEKAIKWPNLTGKPRLDKPWFDGLPRHIFVNDLSDGFCPDACPWDWLAPSIPAMECSPHIWLLLTKWPRRMRKFFVEWDKPVPSNFRLGVSIEKPEYSYRATILAEIPRAIRYISFEPLLASFADYPGILDGISGAIVGGESGPGARPMHPDWARGIRDQCVAAGVPFFFKQWGAWKPIGDFDIETGVYHYSWRHSEPYKQVVSVGTDGKVYNNDYPPRGGWHMARVGKKAAGRLLDGRTWDEMPTLQD